MPRYFFDLTICGKFMSDDEGVELRDLSAVQQEALAVLPALAGERSDSHGQGPLILVVRDETGREVLHGRLDLSVQVLP